MPRGGFRWRMRSGPLILVYHRVSSANGVSGLSVSPEHFAQHLAVLRRKFEPLPLRALLESSPRLRRPAVALTFDDGYADNLLEAVPLLERFAIPATFFATSGMLGGKSEFWWDTLERLVEDEADYWRLHAELLALSEDVRARRLAEMAGSRATELRHRTLTHEELRRLDARDLCEVGAHTISHPLLSSLPREAQRREIADGKAQLEDTLGRDVAYFAYPFGESSAFDDDSVALAREAGFDAAFTGERGTLTERGDRYRIPRCPVRDWDGEKFARRVARWGRR